MPFHPGDPVVVVALNRRGRIVGVTGRRYRVAVGALVTVVDESGLRAVDQKEKKRKAQQPGQSGSRSDSERSGPPGTTRRIDLHGLTTEAAREAVLAAVNAAALAGDEVLEIVHGIGTGRVRDTVRSELARIPVVRHVRPHPTNRGITIVHL